MVVPKNGALNDSREALKAQFAGGFDAADPDPEQGANNNDDDGLSDEIEETPAADAEPAADPAPEPSNQDGGDEDLLKGEAFVKQGDGEFVPKKAFLARLRKEKEARKKFEERLKALEPYEAKKDHYERWDKHKDRFEGSVKFVADLQNALQVNPWAKNILDPLMKGQAPDWKQLVNILKPYMNPFWDGVEIEEEGEIGKPPKELIEVQSRLDKFEAAQKAQAEERENEAYKATRIEARQAEEAKVWTRHKDFSGNQLYRDMLYDRAASIQQMLPEGSVVSLEKVADELFNGLKAQNDAALAARKAAREKARKAAGEGGGGKPGIPIPAEKVDPNKKVDPRAALRDAAVAKYGKTFSA